MAVTILGLDFGSSNISIVKKDEGLVLKEANLICVKNNFDDTYEIKEVGNVAQEMIGKTDSSTSIFSPVNLGKLVSKPYAVNLFKTMLSRLGIKNSLFNKIKVVLALPMALTDKEKQDYIDFLYDSGVDDVVCIPSIFCSALGENINIEANNAKLIVDIGGGTIECAVINLNSIITGGTLFIGGNSMDSSIVEYIKEKYNVEIGILQAKQLKHNIGSLYINDGACEFVTGVNIETNEPIKIKVYANDIYEAIKLFIDETIRIIQATINTLQPEVSADIVRNGIYVCGGCSKTVGFDKYLREKLNININISEQSENACANGLTKLVNNNNMLNSLLLNI